MCDCYETTTKLLTDKVLEEIKDEVGFQKIKDSDFVNKVWLMIDRNLSTTETKVPFTLPFEVKYTRKGKKSGNIREYKKQVSLFPSYCPMCGEKYAL